MRLRALLLAAIMLLTLLPATPALAQGSLTGTIVYLKGGNVWVAAADGSAHHQVTTTGSYGAPTIADDGTIWAVAGTEDVVRLTQSGQQLVRFTPNDVLGAIYAMEVSADGEYLAYGSLARCDRPNGENDTCRNVELMYADGRDLNPLGGVSQNYALTLVPGQPTVVTNSLEYFGPGAEVDATPWFDLGVHDVNDIAFSDDGQLLAIAGCDYDAEDMPLACSPTIEFHRTTGAPPAVPQALPCFLTDSTEAVSYDSVEFSPDGDAIVYAQRPIDAGVSEAEIRITPAFSADPCSGGEATVLAEGAQHPGWSPAPFDPDAGPIDPQQPGETEYFRIDGGGATDPIAQAIATSESLFDDGGADRVVLATADRFPDALAGAALAGFRGPILLTPSAAALDSRVRAEIARVTGGDGHVLVLGGEAAVTEAVAGAARQAAGDRPCTAPLPTTCRFAGTGREHTAALIAETVLAEHGRDRVLLARGDAFADAITGGAYAAAAGVPILLTPSTQLASHTADFLAAHPQITEVVVLGGEAAVSAPVATALEVPAVRRVAGADRTATSAAIATELWQPEGLAGGGVVIVNVRHDQGWQTALTAAVVSAAVGAPQLGVENPPAGPSATVLAAASTVGSPQVIGFGGTDLVSDDQLVAFGS